MVKISPNLNAILKEYNATIENKDISNITIYSSTLNYLTDYDGTNIKIILVQNIETTYIVIIILLISTYFI